MGSQPACQERGTHALNADPDSAQPPEKQQLHKNSTLLEDAKKLAELKVENDDVLAVTLMQDGEMRSLHLHEVLAARGGTLLMLNFLPPLHCGTNADGSFEAIDINSVDAFEPM